jgi:hypothetical protein
MIGNGLKEVYDDKDPKKLTAESKRYRSEQSELVLILLNLAFIPDQVIYDLEDFKHGWSYKFKELMNEYNKKTFPQWTKKLKEIEELNKKI